MGAISLLPLVWQIKFTDSEALGFGFLLIWMLPIPVLLTTVGVIAPIVRLVHRLIKARAAR